jgi:hypothetical protein
MWRLEWIRNNRRGRRTRPNPFSLSRALTASNQPRSTRGSLGSYLRFRKTGDVYRYFGFPATEYQAFLDAESHGRFFLASIRNCYRYEHMAKRRAA